MTIELLMSFIGYTVTIFSFGYMIGSKSQSNKEK